MTSGRGSLAEEVTLKEVPNRSRKSWQRKCSGLALFLGASPPIRIGGEESGCLLDLWSFNRIQLGTSVWLREPGLWFFQEAVECLGAIEYTQSLGLLPCFGLFFFDPRFFQSLLHLATVSANTPSFTQGGGSFTLHLASCHRTAEKLC